MEEAVGGPRRGSSALAFGTAKGELGQVAYDFFSRQYQELELNLNSWKQTIGPFPNRQWIAMLRFMVARALPVFCSSPQIGRSLHHPERKILCGAIISPL